MDGIRRSVLLAALIAWSVSTVGCGGGASKGNVSPGDASTIDEAVVDAENETMADGAEDGAAREVADAQTNDDGAVARDLGIDSDGAAAGDGIAQPVDGGEDICGRLAIVYADVHCPDEDVRVQRCRQNLVSERCRPQSIVVLNCATAAGASAFMCEGDATVLMDGLCQQEIDALTACFSGASTS